MHFVLAGQVLCMLSVFVSLAHDGFSCQVAVRNHPSSQSNEPGADSPAYPLAQIQLLADVEAAAAALVACPDAARGLSAAMAAEGSEAPPQATSAANIALRCMVSWMFSVIPIFRFPDLQQLLTSPASRMSIRFNSMSATVAAEGSRA